MTQGLLDDIYQEVILDHYKNPRRKGSFDCPNKSCALYNPLCGDKVELFVNFDNDKIVRVGFSGKGCSISQAASSMMSELCEGKTINEAKLLIEDFRSLMRGEIDPEGSPQLGDAVSLQGVRKFSARVKCAMLAWEAMEKVLEQSQDDLKLVKLQTN